MNFWDLSLFFSCFATVLLSLPSLDAMSAPNAERMMRHLVLNPFLFALVSRIVFLRSLLFSKLPLSPGSCSSDFSCSTSSTSSIVVTRTSFLAAMCVFGITAFTNFFHVLVHAGRLKNRRHFIRVRLVEPACACSLESSDHCSCSRFLRSEHDDVSLVDNRTHGRQSVQELHVALLTSQTNSILPSPSTRIGSR